MDINSIKGMIHNKQTSLGIELGSTRIKAVLVDKDCNPIAMGSHEWENRLTDGIWTYTNEDIISGLQSCYKSLTDEIKRKYGIIPDGYGAIGISAMMHGYMAFDNKDRLLVPFRTWRNTITEKQSEELTELFDFPIPQRWSVAHLYKEIEENSEHLKHLAYINTLAGYVHFLLSGEKVLGIGEASGMFPIDSENLCYNKSYADKFDLNAREYGFDIPILSLLPRVLTAGENAGALTECGAKLLCPDGTLKAGALMCPPEGDAGTGMVATNSVSAGTGNVSAGTSVFAMAVLEKPLKRAHKEIDMVTTPTGSPVAMVHCNNCTSELNAWAGMFHEVLQRAGCEMSMGDLYEMLFKAAANGDKACKGMTAIGYLSGEHVTGFSEGRPLFVRNPDTKLSLDSFMRTQTYSALGALACGMEILFNEEDITLSRLTGHGGFFKTEGVGQSVLAAAVNTPVSVMETAGEGGAWGMAVLAAYMTEKSDGYQKALDEYLGECVFKNAKVKTVQPSKEDVAGYKEFLASYRNGLKVERAAVENL